MTAVQNDFSQGSVVKNIANLALPMTLAQLVNVLYNVVDRVYIGHMPQNATESLTGLGLCLPVISIVIAFANLFGMGGAPLCSIERGRGNEEEAERIMGNSFTLLVISGLILTAVGLIFKRPLLYLFGASDVTYPYADDYMTIYLLGSVFVMVGLGMNAFVNSQGFAKIGMLTVLLGAVANLILDPVFIFVFGMGVSGAALATILSQAVSAAWVLRFLFSAKSGIRIRRGNMKFEKRVVGKVIGLGIAPFIMQSTESLVNITLNAGLQRYGGDLYVGSMTIMQSVMQMLVMPIQGITQGAQPIMSYNYGAKNYSRVRKTFSLLLKVMLLVTVSGFALAALLPGVLARMFTQDAELIEIVKKMMPIFFGGIWAFGAQMACQTTFMALGQAKISLFLALLRKVVLLVPLALLLPVVMGGNVLGIYIAEPVADVIASFTTLSLFLIKRKTLLPDGGAPAKSK